MKFLMPILFLTLFISATIYSPDIANEATHVCLSAEEMKLYHAINDYRASKNLDVIPLSNSLSLVAQTHSKDLNDNYKSSKRCNLHSWSKKGRWSSCCYTPDHKQATCMWDKPRELTDYEGDGFEIAFAKYRSDNSDPQLMAEEALEGWKNSKGHNTVMINKGSFKNLEWKAIGIGIYRGYATVWFGTEKDVLNSPTVCN